MSYADKTSVGSDRSRAEIEKTLTRYGASSFAYGWQDRSAMVGFEMEGRRVQFILPLPDRNAHEYTHTPSQGNLRSPAHAESAYEQAVRQKWRALSLVIKVKLEAVESGITCFDDEFLAHICLPNGQTVGQWVGPQIDTAYETCHMPKMLPIIKRISE